MRDYLYFFAFDSVAVKIPLDNGGQQRVQIASSIPLRGVDMGNAILAMHSCRETGSTADHIYCVKAFTKFFE